MVKDDEKTLYLIVGSIMLLSIIIMGCRLAFTYTNNHTKIEKSWQDADQKEEELDAKADSIKSFQEAELDYK